MKIQFTVFTALTMMGLVAGDALDDSFRPYRTGSDSDKFGGVIGGRCYSTGSSRRDGICPRFTYGFIGTLELLEVDDDDGTDFEKGVRNCAEACAAYGVKDTLPADEALWSPRDQYQGEFVCNSFDYRPQQANNCYLHPNPARSLQGTRPGSTRVDYTENYCYQRNGDNFSIPCNKLCQDGISQIRSDQIYENTPRICDAKANLKSEGKESCDSWCERLNGGKAECVEAFKRVNSDGVKSGQIGCDVEGRGTAICRCETD